MSMRKNKHQIGFAIDIDGTLVISGKPIPQAKIVIDRFMQDQVPFVLLTNNIARSQSIRAQQISDILQLQKQLTGNDVILNFTPMKPRFQDYQNKVVLVIGRQHRLRDILPLQQIPKFITIDQYCSIFPQSLPLSYRKHGPDNQVVNQVCKRLGVEQLNKHSLQFSAILLLTTPIHWEQCYQAIIDVLSTQNGTVSMDNKYHHVPNHIPVIAAFNDIFHCSNTHNLPRLLMKPFTEGLKAVYKTIYHNQLVIQTYGKPEAVVYHFTKNHLQKYYGSIQKMVMIGDSIESDIIGPSKVGWDTILVKTGVARVDSEIATINADNILDGVQAYFKSLK